MHTSPYSRAWLFQHLRLLLLGLTIGVVAVGFRVALEATDQLRPALMGTVGQGGAALVVSVAFSLATILPAVWLVSAFCPEARGSGIPQAKALALHPSPIRWLRLLLVKFFGGVLGIGGGLVLGREGPTVQMGTAVGEMVGSLTRVTPGERRQLLILGAGAGLAGAFNAPLAGAVFIFEELGEQFRPATCLTALMTTFGADLVCRAFTSQLPQLGSFAGGQPAFYLMPAFLLVGWTGGVLGVVFNQTLLASLRGARAIQRRGLNWALPVVLACLTGFIGWLSPTWVGSGDRLLGTLRGGQMELTVALWLLGLRFTLTVGGYVIGVAGGLFAPLLVLGALVGTCGGQLMPRAGPTALVVVAMAALFTGAVRTPLTGILLMVEMAGGYDLIVPLIAACVTAKLTADALGDRPIYDALMEESPASSLTPASHRSPSPD